MSDAEDNNGQARSQSKPPLDDPQDIRPGDYYFEGPNIVFTEQYHLRRGYCCDSGCRHCPYK